MIKLKTGRTFKKLFLALQRKKWKFTAFVLTISFKQKEFFKIKISFFSGAIIWFLLQRFF